MLVASNRRLVPSGLAHPAHLLAVLQAIRVYSLTTDAIVYSSAFPYPDIVSSLRWATHDNDALLAAAGNTAACWRYKRTEEWQLLYSFRATITCMQQSATEPRFLAVGCADTSLHLFDVTLAKVCSWDDDLDDRIDAHMPCSCGIQVCHTAVHVDGGGSLMDAAEATKSALT